MSTDTSWNERNPERDPDSRIRDIYRDLYPSQSEDVPTGGGYNEDGDGPTTVPGGFHPRRALNDPSERAFLADGGWSIVDAQSDYANAQRRGGITSRKPAPGEFYVDPEELQILAEQRLGFTFVEYRRCYGKRGPKPESIRHLSERIAIRLARLTDNGQYHDGTDQLAELLDVKPPTLRRIIARGRALLAARVAVAVGVSAGGTAGSFAQASGLPVARAAA